MRKTPHILIAAALAGCGSGADDFGPTTGGGAITADGHVVNLLQPAGAPAPAIAPEATTPLAPVAASPQPEPAGPAPSPVGTLVGSDPAVAPTPPPAPPPSLEPAPPAYTEAQYQVKAVVETEVAAITSHVLDASDEMPAWVARFEPLRPVMSPWAWRQEIRRRAIEEGRRLSWPDAPTRGRFDARGSLISVLRCVPANGRSSRAVQVDYRLDHAEIIVRAGTEDETRDTLENGIDWQRGRVTRKTLRIEPDDHAMLVETAGRRWAARTLYRWNDTGRMLAVEIDDSEGSVSCR